MRTNGKRLVGLLLVVCLTALSFSALAQQLVFSTMLIVARRDATQPSGFGAADALIVAVYHTDTGNVRMLSLDRTTGLRIGDAVWALSDVITQYGAQGVVAVIQALYGIDIPNYVLVDMEGVPKLIDAVGGAMFSLNEEDIALLGLDGGAGGYLLNGEQAQVYMAQRQGDTDDTLSARKNSVFEAFKNQLTTGKANLSMDFFMSLLTMVETNISLIALTRLGANVLSNGLGTIERIGMPLSEDNMPGADMSMSQNELMRLYLY